MEPTHFGDRLDRLEGKIDKLADAMIALARTEEKIFSLEADRTNMAARINRHGERLDEMTLAVAENTRIVNAIVKITWILVAAVVTVLGGVIKMMFF